MISTNANILYIYINILYLYIYLSEIIVSVKNRIKYTVKVEHY